MCDISMPGVLFNDFKLSALRNLTFQQYQRAFFLRDSASEEAHSWLNLIPKPSDFPALKGQVSRQTLTFFDTLSSHLSEHGIKRIDPMLARYRKSRFQFDHFPQVIGDIVGTETQYNELRQKALRTPVAIHLRDIASYLKTAREFDVVYLSNVCYQPELSAKLAGDFVSAGAQIAYTAINPMWLNFEKQFEALSNLQARLREDRCFIEIAGLRAEILGWEPRVEFGLLLKFTDLPPRGVRGATRAQ